MGTLPQSVSQACPGLWTQAKASEPWAGVGEYQRMLPSPKPAHLFFPHFPLAPLVLCAHWPLYSSQGVPPEVRAFPFHPLGHGVAVSCLLMPQGSISYLSPDT